MARKMKDSGIEWIGEIPEGWSVSKVLHCLSMPITDGPHTTPILYDTGIPFVSAEAVSCGNGRIDFSHIRGYISEQFYKECCQKYVPEIDDIYMIKSGATTGRVAIVDTTRVFTIWSPLAVFRCNKDCMLPKFLYYYLQSPAFQKEVEFGWTFGTQQNVGMRSLEQMKVCVPQLNKQDTIANYLEYQCSQIDLLLQKALTSIEEYKKLKQAVITQAVTKGVRGERVMKDSGNPWFGQIPTDWKLSRVGLHFSIILGKMLCNAPLNDTYTLEPYYCAADVHFDGVADGERKKMWFSPIEKDLYRVSVGDLLVVEGGAGAGGSAIVENQDSYTYIQNSIMIVRSKGNTNNRYLRYLLEFLVKQGYIDIVCNKATIPHFTKDKLSCVPFCLCPTGEQEEIADYLDAKCAEIDKLIAKKEQLVKELESYKKSLIYEVVTGKREV